MSMKLSVIALPPLQSENWVIYFPYLEQLFNLTKNTGDTGLLYLQNISTISIK